MNFDPPLIRGQLVKRYKRFLADIRLEDETELTVHCPNPGAMMGLCEPGSAVWISDSNNPKRKLRYTLELMQVGQSMVGINTNRANALALEALTSGLVEGVDPETRFVPEQKYGENSRIDFLAKQANSTKLYVEVKNVHLSRHAGLYEFPDCVTARGAKHLGELAKQVEMGNRAMMLFLVQRNDGASFRIATDLDPNYAKAFERAVESGVEMRCVDCDIRHDGITPLRPVRIEF